MRVEFAKYHGLGNDFIVVEARGRSLIGRAHVESLCDRRRGIGADGIIIVAMGEEGPRMTVYNADGTQPEMCGNGLRCAAFHLVRKGWVEHQTFVVDTDAGPHRCIVMANADDRASVEISMRAAEWATLNGEPFVDKPLEVDGVKLRVSSLSMGNPHAVIIEENLSALDRTRVAPLVEKNALFPEGANVGFVRSHEGGGIELKVWERGVGWTAACGTGACAAAAVAVRLGLVKTQDAIAVQLPGGELQISVRLPDYAITMRGPAVHVFDGSLEID